MLGKDEAYRKKRAEELADRRRCRRNRKRKGMHLTWNDRLMIEKMLLRGIEKRVIADTIGCCLATVYNEIKRATYVHTNSDLTEEVRYNPDQAEWNYCKCLAEKGVKPMLLEDEEQLAYIEKEILEKQYSPAAVIMAAKHNQENHQFENPVQSVNTIYKAAARGYFDHLELSQLPESGRRKKKRQKRKGIQKKAPKGTSIEERPETIDERGDFGNWEMDCVLGAKKSKKCLLVFTERKTRYEIIEVLKFHTADEVVKALNRLEKRYGAKFYSLFQTITVDNGSEFTDFDKMEKALYRVGKRTQIYYCHPYVPSERGSNENGNKMIRRWFPKGTDFDQTINKAAVKDAEEWMNNYPRKILDGKTAFQCFQDEVRKLGFT
ncbi:MAG: IS30 family transposase [Anaerovoracaceae bacterium]|nr:IS30 family transposase [Anaerovoracaceae bacterium]